MVGVDRRFRLPEVGGFGVGFQAQLVVAFVDGGVETLSVEAPSIYQ